VTTTFTDDYRCARSAFLAAARAAGADVLVGDPGRPSLPADRLELVSLHSVPETEGEGSRRTTVWRLP